MSRIHLMLWMAVAILAGLRLYLKIRWERHRKMQAQGSRPDR